MNQALLFAERTFVWILQTSWQAGVLVVVILLAQALFRHRLPPAWRYGLWLVLLVRLLLPYSPRTSYSIYNVARLPDSKAEGASVFQSAERPGSRPTPAIFQDETRVKLPASGTPRLQAPQLASPAANALVRHSEAWISWRRSALFLWLTGACLLGARLVWSNFRFAREVSRGQRVNDTPILQVLTLCQKTLGTFQSIELIESDAVRSPSVHGLWQKRLILPTGMPRDFSLEELRHIFLHELAHVKRRDLEVNWIASLLLVLHWFNPLLWLAFSIMRDDREVACDALVLTKTGASLARPYGETIIKVVGGRLDTPKVPGVLALWEDSKRLKERILMIAGFKAWPRLPGLAAALVTGIAVVGLTNGRADRAEAAVDQDGARPAKSAEIDGGVLSAGIRGRVVDSRGAPVAGASVTCQGFDWSMFTDAQGRFSWKGESHPRNFEIQKTGYKTLFTDLLSPAIGEAILHLQHALVIAGRVKDKATGEPISSFQVGHIRVLQGPVTPSLSPRETILGQSGAFRYFFPDFFWPDSAFYIDAEGYLPMVSRPLLLSDDGSELQFELTRAQPVQGRVLTPEGNPADKSEVRLWCGEINIADIPRSHKVESDENGGFVVPPVLDGKILVYHNSGYAELDWKDFLATHTVQLAEWGHVKGHWPQPLPKSRRISLDRMNWTGQRNTYALPPPWTISSTEVKPDGSFEFEEGAPPGEYMITEWSHLRIDYPGGGNSMALLMSKRMPVLIEAGRTTVVEIPAGRSVIGRMSAGDEESLTNVHLPIVSLRLKQSVPDLGFPPMDKSRSEAQTFELWKEHRTHALEYWLSDEGKAQRRAERVFEVAAGPDGVFQIDNVPPAVYDLDINGQRWSGKAGPEIRREIAIPPASDGTPINLGIVR